MTVRARKFRSIEAALHETTGLQMRVWPGIGEWDLPRLSTHCPKCGQFFKTRRKKESRIAPMAASDLPAWIQLEATNLAVLVREHCQTETKP